MTKQTCMLKLLEHGPLSIRECYEITGWPRQVVRKTLERLRAEGLVQHSGEWYGMYFL
jgi:predicted ArsR family transcriptional regulator